MPGLDSADKPSAQPSRRIDLAIGIVLGLVLGIAIVSAFVFLGSEGSVDAPRISGVNAGKPTPESSRTPRSHVYAGESQQGERGGPTWGRTEGEKVARQRLDLVSSKAAGHSRS